MRVSVLVMAGWLAAAGLGHAAERGRARDPAVEALNRRELAVVSGRDGAVPAVPEAVGPPVLGAPLMPDLRR